MDASCPATEEAADADGDPHPPQFGLVVKAEDEVYVESLFRVSLLLVSEDFSLQVQHHGSKMLQHLLKYRHEKLSSADILDLTLQLVRPPNESALKSAAAVSEDAVTKTEKRKEDNKQNRSLLVLAAKNNLKSLVLEKTGVEGNEEEGADEAIASSVFLSSGNRPLVFGDERVDFSLALDPNFQPGHLSHLCYPSYSHRAPPCPKSVFSHGIFRWFGRMVTNKHQVYQIDHALKQKNLSYSLPQDPHLHSLPFPIDGPVPISWFGLGTQSDYSNTQKSSNSSYGSGSSANSNSSSPSKTDGSSPGKSDGSSPGKSDGSSPGKRSQNSHQSMTFTGNDEMMSYHQGMGYILLIEHNFLSEAFLITTSCLRVHQYMRVLPCLLDSLNKIWAQMEWNKYVHGASGLSCLLSDDRFLKMVYHVVKFCEEELMRSRIEESDASDVFPVALLQSILPLFLRLLKCIHALWSFEVDVDLLPEELERAKSLSCMELAPILESTDGLNTIDSDKCFHENETRALLEGTRHRVYNVIGLCTSVEGAFSELLDSLSVSDAFVDTLEYMEFRHLGKLIRLVVIPLIKHCPRKFWKEWTVNFLEPILFQCEDKLYRAWFSLMYDWPAEKLYNYGKLVGLDEQRKDLEQKLLLKFTREVSDLLGVLALTEQTNVRPTCNNVMASSQDLDSMSSSSLFRFLLLNNCFGRLRMGLFGYFVDDEAAIKAIPFCRCLIWLAVSINDVRLRLLIVDDLLPCLIRRLDNQLQCATQRLIHKLRSSAPSSATQDLVVLCEELYDYLIKDSAGEGKDSSCAQNNFTSWLAKKKEDLRVKACSAAKELPEGSDWNWEFEDEFHRYLPAYMEMLQQVDSIDGYEERDYWEEEALFQKLAPEFRSKYGMNSSAHPYMVTISSLRQQQCELLSAFMYQRKEGKFLSELIKLKPYIKASDCPSAIIHRLQENSEIISEVPESVSPCLDVLRNVLFIWEPLFHPLIRKSHMNILLWIVDHLTKYNEREYCQQVAPATCDFELHLQPYADAFFETKLKESMYHRAVEQICLHKEFDGHLASGGLDHRMDEFISSRDDFVKNLVNDEMATMKFSDLNHDLIKLSLERRAKIVKLKHQVCTYSDCLRSLLEDESLEGQLEVLMNELKIEGFFDTDNDSVNWEKQRFSELVDQFNHKVFARHSLPKHYVIRGIMDYRLILMRKNISRLDAFKEVVHDVCERWIKSCERLWRVTRYYEHLYYNIVRRPLEQVFMK